MADHSSIEWTDATWNPITGCTLVSEGCRNCYAARLAATRLAHLRSRAGLARVNAEGVAKFTGEVRFNREWLTQPLQWKRPRMIFVCAHGDLFAEGVPDEWIDQVFAVMALAPQHTFQVLTKRPKRMREYLRLENCQRTVEAAIWSLLGTKLGSKIEHGGQWRPAWPMPNVWLGTSIEDQAAADARVPQLLATPAAVRFVSAEPLLGFIDLSGIHPGGGVVINALKGSRFDVFDASAGEDVEPYAKLHWVIVGGESGPRARPMHPDAVRFLREQCAADHVPFFFKQWGEHEPGELIGDDRPEPWRRRPDGRESWSLQELGKARTELSPVTFAAVGKTRAGRLLDGLEHNGMPAKFSA